MENKLTRQGLFDFLDYMMEKGLANKNTISARKAAANKVLGILDDNEARDISQLDLDALMERFCNLSGSNYMPDSLQVYKSRVKSALDDYVSYNENPLTFRTAATKKRSSPNKPKAVGQTKSNKEPPQRLDNLESEKVSAVRIGNANDSILPIPIRPDLIVYIQGLPFNLTASEADKISNVVKAMSSKE